MKCLVSSFFVGTVCLCCEVSSMAPEVLYSGNVGSEHARTYIYPCEFPRNNGMHFVSAITVDVGNNNYPSAQEMLAQLNGLLTGGLQENVGQGQQNPRVIWSGSFHFSREAGSSMPGINSVVNFYSVYNEDTYLRPADGQEIQHRESHTYRSEQIDRFVRRVVGHVNFLTLEDHREHYLHCSNGREAVYYGNRRSGWRGEGSVTRVGDCVNADLGSMRVRALSMNEFLTGIGRSQGHYGHIFNRGKLFAPWCSLLKRETGRTFVDSVLREFEGPGYRENQ